MILRHVLIIIIIILRTLDYGSTEYGLKKGCYETNSIMKSSLMRKIMYPLPLIYAFFLEWVNYILIEYPFVNIATIGFFNILIIFYIITIINNIFQINKEGKK